MLSSLPFVIDPGNEPYLNRWTSKLNGGKFSLRVLAFVGLLVLAPMSLIFAARMILTSTQYSREGVKTNAVVTDTRISGTRSATFYLTYQYTVQQANGQQATFSNEAAVGHDTFRTYGNANQKLPLPIRYLPNDPSQSQLIDDNSLLLYGAALAIIGFLSGGGLVFVGFGIKDHMQLQKYGRILEGEITDTRLKIRTLRKRGINGDFEKDVSMNIAYKFTTPSGTLVTDSTICTRIDVEWLRPEIGTPLAILYVDDRLYTVL